jgi:predicted permease
MPHRALTWLRSLFLRRRQEREMGEEMGQHIERATSRLMTRGMSQAEAERQAHREFGNMAYIQETARDARGHRWVESVAQDLRYALRQFGRSPLSTVSMMVILSLGIGSSTGLFTLLNSLLTQPPPGVAQQDGLVRIRGRAPDGSDGTRPMSYPEVAALAAQQGTFSAVSGYTSDDVVLHLESEEVFSGLGWYVSPDYFDVLGVRPALGSPLPAAADAENTLVAIISDDMWREHFSSSADVIGRGIRVNGLPVTIIGVAPPRFQGIAGNPGPRVLWLPLQARATTNGHGAAFLSSRDSALFRAVATLAPGATLARANATVRGVAQQYLRQGTPTGSAAAADVVPLLDSNNNYPSYNGELVAGLFFGTLCLLIVLVTCANVSALLTGIAATRRREIAVRLTMGASRARVVRQLLVESVALAIGAGTIALAVTTAVLVVAQRKITDFTVVLDWRMAAWTLGAALLTAVLFGMAPALHATRLSLAGVLKDSANAVAGSRSPLQRLLVVVQVAVTQPLLVMVVAMVVGGAAQLRHSTDTQLNERLTLMSFDIQAGSVHPDVRRAEVLAATEQVRGLSGVVDVVPIVYGAVRYDVVVHADDRVGAAGTEAIQLSGRYAAPGYFGLRNIRLVAGREFTRDDEDAVIIDAHLARELWGTSSPIGRRFIPTAENGASSTPLAIVGVIDPPGAAQQAEGPRSVYVHETPVSPSWIMIRTQGDALPMLRTFREAATAAAPALPVGDVTTVAQNEAEARLNVMTLVMITGGGALMALALAALGLYAVVAQSVKQRRREIGIRSALGADHLRVSGLFFRRGLRLSLIGLAMGLPFGVFAVSWLMQDSDGLLTTTSLSIATLLVAAAVVMVASLASWIPARAAARVDPVQALRLD